MKASHANTTPHRRPSGRVGTRARMVLLMLMTGLLVLSMGWRAAHRYGYDEQHASHHLLPGKPLPFPNSR